MIFNEHSLFLGNYFSSQYTFEYAYLYFKYASRMKTNMVLDKDMKTTSHQLLFFHLNIDFLSLYERDKMGQRLWAKNYLTLCGKVGSWAVQGPSRGCRNS